MNLQESIRRILREEIEKISLKSILTKIDPPSILHHYSSSKNRDSILKRGLLPKIGERTKNFITNNELNLEPVPLIFAQDPKHGNFFGVYGNDIWEIDLTKLDNNWYKDPIHEKTEPEWYFYVTTEPIPPSAIKLIGSNEEADKAKEIYLKTGKQPKIDLTPEEKERIKKEKEAEELKAKQDKEFNELPDDIKNMDIGDLMNLQESIRRILKEEISNPVNLIKRRIDTVDWLVDFSVREIERQYNGICNVRTPENFVEIVIEKTGDGMYWDYFADKLDDDSDEWGQMYRFIERYVKNKFGDKLREHYHIQCGD